MRTASFTFGIALAAIAITGALLNGCSSMSGNCIEGSNKKISIEPKIGDFSGITSIGSIKIYLTQGEKTSLRIEGDDNIASRLQQRIEEGNLILGSDECYISSNPIIAYITAKNIEKISLNGSGDIISSGPISISKLSIDVNGSGKVNMQTSGDDVKIKISGSGSVTLNGAATNVDITMQGSGIFRGYGLQSINTRANIIGSGDIETTTMNILDATIHGSGDIFYKGNPETVKQVIEGSGSLKKRF